MKCNQTLSKQLDYNNWITLSAYVDEYIKSGMVFFSLQFFKYNFLVYVKYIFNIFLV